MKPRSAEWFELYNLETSRLISRPSIPCEYQQNRKIYLNRLSFLSDCGHNYKKPFPPINAGKPEVPLKKQDSKKGKGKKASAKTSTDSSQPVIIDYMSKEQFAMSAPKTDDDIEVYAMKNTHSDCCRWCVVFPSKILQQSRSLGSE
jgi:hypothetical protein